MGSAELPALGFPSGVPIFPSIILIMLVFGTGRDNLPWSTRFADDIVRVRGEESGAAVGARPADILGLDLLGGRAGSAAGGHCPWMLLALGVRGRWAFSLDIGLARAEEAIRPRRRTFRAGGGPPLWLIIVQLAVVPPLGRVNLAGRLRDQVGSGPSNNGRGCFFSATPPPRFFLAPGLHRS